MEKVYSELSIQLSYCPFLGKIFVYFEAKRGRNGTDWCFKFSSGFWMVFWMKYLFSECVFVLLGPLAVPDAAAQGHGDPGRGSDAEGAAGHRW